MTLDELKLASPSLAELVLEACGKRSALAVHLVEQISALAAEKATAVERERCAAHLFIGERHAATMPLVSEAIRTGAGLDQEARDQYMRAVTERRNPALSLIKGDK